MTIDGSYSFSELLGLVLRSYVVPQRQQDPGRLRGCCSAGMAWQNGRGRPEGAGAGVMTRCRPFPLRSEVLSLSLS